MSTPKHTPQLKVSELSVKHNELMTQIRSAQRIANRFNIQITPSMAGLEVYVEGANNSLWKSICDLIIESEPTADAPVSRKDLEDLFTLFDFTSEEKQRLYVACEINDENYNQWADEERRNYE